MSTLITTERQDRVLTVSLNRPELGNAFNGQLIAELTQAFLEVSGEAGIHAVVLTGTGKHFCAGADLGWMRSAATLGHEANKADALQLGALFAAIDQCQKPVVGRFFGAARGGGVGLVAAVDIPIASEDASFALTEVRLGLAPAVISPFVVAKLGQNRARELFLTAEVFSAQEALQWGLLNHVVAREELDSKVKAKLDLLLRGGPKALAASKTLAREVGQKGPSEVADWTASIIAGLRVSPEGQEGMRAFLEKDQPAWTKAGQESA